MTLSGVLHIAAGRSTKSGVAEADYHYLISNATGYSLSQIRLAPDTELSPEQAHSLISQFDRMERFEPPQYITGKAYFYGLELAVNPQVLIPRPETEGLVELVLSKLQGNERILDIGTGSGAIAIALKLAMPSLQMVASDISTAALELATGNAARHSADITFHHCDLYPASIPQKGASVVPIPELFDLIISNPPYISEQEYSLLEPRVRNHEPALALKSGADGLDHIRGILSDASSHLTEQGFIAFEHGISQALQIISLAAQAGFSTTESHKDLSGRNRYLLLWLDQPKLLHSKINQTK